MLYSSTSRILGIPKCLKRLRRAVTTSQKPRPEALFCLWVITLTATLYNSNFSQNPTHVHISSSSEPDWFLRLDKAQFLGPWSSIIVMKHLIILKQGFLFHIALGLINYVDSSTKMKMAYPHP